MLDLPDIAPTVAENTPQPGPGRRRALLLAGAGLVVAAGGGFAVREWPRDDAGGPGGAKSGERGWVIGVQADLSGPQSAAGRAQERGVRLAAQRFNSRKGKPFTLTVKVLDDRGDAGRAQRVAAQFTRDRDVLAVVGPTGDRTTEAVLGAYDEVMLPVLTVSSLQLKYAARSQRSFFQAGPVEAALCRPIINRLVLRPDVERLGVLLDRAGGQVGYQVGYLTNMQTGLLTTGTTYPRVIPAGTQDLAPVVDDMLAHASDAFFYAGDVAGAARTARALAATPFKGPRMAIHTVMTARFIEEAGESAEGWEFTAPYIDATAPAAEEFTAAHRAEYGQAPAHWAAEAYDAAGLVMAAVTALAGGRGTPKRPARAALVAKIAASSYKGVSRTYAFGEDHQLKSSDAYLYAVRDGRFVHLGAAPKATA